MKIEINMCYSHLMSMLMMPEAFNKAVYKYESSSPNIEHEGMAGYMETIVIFHLKDLSAFATLFEKSRKYLTDNPSFYFRVRDGQGCN